MERKAAQEFVSRWVPNFTPEFRRFLATHLGRDSGVFTSGTFTFGDGRGCLAEHAGRFHPRTRSSRQPGVEFLRLIGLENGDSQIIDAWDRPRSEGERRQFEVDLRSLLQGGNPWLSRGVPVHSDLRRGTTLTEELDRLGISLVATAFAVVSSLVSSIACALCVALRVVGEDIAAMVDGVDRRVVGNQQAARIHVHDQAVNHPLCSNVATIHPVEHSSESRQIDDEADVQTPAPQPSGKHSRADDWGEQEHPDSARRQCRRPQPERDASPRLPNMRGVPVRADRKSAVKSWAADSERLATAKSAHHSATKAEFMPLQAGRGSFDAKRVADRGAL